MAISRLPPSLHRIHQANHIGILPPEILEEIFSFCMIWVYEQKRVPNSMAWAKVCRSWHELSLNSTRLWRTVDLTNVKSAHCALQRSRESLISLIAIRPAYFLPPGLSMQGYRVQSIDACLFPDDMENLFTILGPCPLLSSLTLRTPAASPSIPYIDIDCSNIRHLHLTSVEVPWETCTDLLTLSLRRLEEESAPSVESLLGMLRRSPRLKHVQLVDVQLRIPMWHGLMMEHDDPEGVVDVRTATSAAAVKAMLGTLSRHHQTLPDDPISSFNSIGVHQVVKLRIDDHQATFYEDDSPKPWTNDDDSVILSVATSAFPIPSLPELFDVSHLSALEIGKGMLAHITGDQLRSLLVNVPKLESLRIGPKNDLSEILDLLAEPSLFLCPMLSSTSFGNNYEYWRHFRSEYLKGVIAFAESRFAMGYPLKHISFIKCEGVAPESAAALSAVADQLDIIGSPSQGGSSPSTAYVFEF